VDWKDVAARHGINPRRAYQLIELLDDTPEIRGAMERGAIREGHAAELRRAPVDQQTQLLEQVVARRLSVVDTRKLIADVRDVTPPPAPPRPSASATQEQRTSAPPPVATVPAPQPASMGPTAGAVAAALEAAGATPAPQHTTAATVGAAIAEEKARRERTRRLRQRLENIARELRNMHMEEVTAEYTQLPEIIVRARQARDSLDAFINLLERVQLDQAGAMESPTL
jgi:hypothetical protein